MTIMETFQLVAPEYKSVGYDIVQKWIELTAPLVSKKQFGKLYEQAVALLTAHRMKLAGTDTEQAAEGSGGLQLGIAETLRVSSYSEGSTSISFKDSAVTGGSSSSNLTLTEYGIQFSELRNMVVIPIHCSGEVR